MSVEWYDLAQRLHAARTGRVVPRLLHAPLARAGHPVAVRARAQGSSVVVTAATAAAPARTARDQQALDLLGDLGVRLDTPGWASLVTEDSATLPALLALARRSGSEGPAAEVAAHIAWWAERADFPGTSAVVPLVAACRARWVTGEVPDAETAAATWRSWLGVADQGCAGMLELAGHVDAGEPLPLLAAVTEDDAWTWAAAQREHAEGWNWRRADTTSRAATGLKARCDAADLFTAALLGDPVHRRRAVHTGHVVVGSVGGVVQARGALAVTCERMDARLRVGNAVTGWVGRPEVQAAERFGGTITATGVTAGQLVLTLGGVGAHRPGAGEQVSVVPAAPNVSTMRAGRGRYRRLYSARRSWLTTGRTPTATRRDVPLEVLVAAAEQH